MYNFATIVIPLPVVIALNKYYILQKTTQFKSSFL